MCHFDNCTNEAPMSEWRQWRERAGLKQETVAHQLRMSRAHYSRLENGLRNMDLNIARDLAVLFNLSPAEKAALLSTPDDTAAGSAT